MPSKFHYLGVTEEQQGCIVTALNGWVELGPDRKKFATRVKRDHGRGKRRIRLDATTIRDVPDLIRSARNIAYQRSLYRVRADIHALCWNTDVKSRLRSRWKCSGEVGVRNSKTVFMNGQFYKPNEVFDWVDRSGAYIEAKDENSPQAFHLKSHDVWVDSSQVRLATPLEMLAASAD